MACAQGFGELRFIGSEIGSRAAFAALRDLLHPVLIQIAELPARQHQALPTGFGVADGPEPEALLIGLAVPGLLEQVVTRRRLLVVVEGLGCLPEAGSAHLPGIVAADLSPVCWASSTTSSG